jgi:hypothetical protein
VRATLVWAVQAGPVKPRAENRPNTVCHVFGFSFSFINLEKSNKLLKYVENAIQLRKIQINFCENPFEQIYVIGLTKSLFVHYCIV